jgi:uncharacterized protein (TIGR00369 family)
MSELPPRPISASRIQLVQFMQPEHANGLGNVHGGVIMKLVDEAGALAAMRHAQSFVVTVAVDSMAFVEPIRIGALVTVKAELAYVGTTSMEARVEVIAENPLTGEKTHTNTAHLVYVAIDGMGRPRPVPKLIAQTPEEEASMEAARHRAALRKQLRAGR